MKNRSAAKKELRENQQKKRELDRILQKLGKELKAMEASKPLERYSIIIECETSNEGELNFEIVYNIYNAGWTPLYDFRLIKNILDTTYFGQITQKTGEDWSNVSLKLSTAPPSSGTVIPKLNPWFISPVKAPKNQYFDTPMTGLTQAAAAPPSAGNSAEIKVQNFTDKNQKVIIRDHIPISKHEHIKVKLKDTKPNPEKTDKLNRLEWVIETEIKKEYYICYDFTIEFPMEMKISSLP